MTTCYRDKLDDIMYDVNNKSISTKILQHMDKIRNNDDEGQARRFVWELIQNAKDVAQENVPLKIQMTLYDDKFVFQHNGRNFELKNLLSLINQVSGKTGEGTTGKFGTGFITTHILSERVTVNGILEDYGLAPKRFSVMLDRSGRDNKEIISAVDKAMDTVREVDNSEIAEYSPEDLNTSFEYSLNTEYSKNVAITGMNDAVYNLFYVMAFVPRISEITLVNKTNDTQIIYKKDAEQTISESITVYTVFENETLHKIVRFKKDSAEIAVEIDSENNVVAIDPKSSRLFCDFPLIDNQTFPVPVAVNSCNFKVNEPRSCITLTDNPNSTDSELNKQIMTDAMDVYSMMLDYMIENNCGKIYNIIHTPEVFSRSDLSAQWISENIINRIGEEVSQKRVIPCTFGKIESRYAKIAIPANKEKSLMEEMNVLLHYMGFDIITENIDEWSKALISVGNTNIRIFSIRTILEFAQKYENTDELAQILRINVFEWLKKLYDCAVKTEEIKNEIHVGEHSIFPVQSGKLKNITEVYRDENGIDEYFKDISDLADNYLTDKLHIRDKLLVAEYNSEGCNIIKKFPLSTLENYLYKATSYNSSCTSASNVRRKMLACLPDEKGFEIISKLVSEPPVRYNPECKLAEKTWDVIYEYSVRWMHNRLNTIWNEGIIISEFGSREKAIEAMNYYCNLKKKFNVYDATYYFAFSYSEENTNSMIRFNESYNNVFIDNDLDPMLLKVFLKMNFKDVYIIDKMCDHCCPTLNRMGDFEIAGKISNKITSELKIGALYTKSESFQQACSLLMCWINNNEKTASEILPAFSSKEDRMQLLTPNEASRMSEKLDTFETLMKKYNCSNIEELEEQISAHNSSCASITPETEITEEYYAFGYSKDLNNLEQVFREIGERGEQLALELLTNQYSDCTVTLKNTDEYKQQGYDITVEQPDGTILYYEVKTRTKTSMFRYTLSFSNAQSRNITKDNYRVLVIVIDKNKALHGYKEFNDVFDMFAHGNFYRTDGYEIIMK